MGHTLERPELPSAEHIPMTIIKPDFDESVNLIRSVLRDRPSDWRSYKWDYPAEIRKRI
jgi:hypothetical protein